MNDKIKVPLLFCFVIVWLIVTSPILIAVIIKEYLKGNKIVGMKINLNKKHSYDDDVREEMK